MILIFKAIIMAIIEGLTEFVPVSSTGHMILVGHLIDFNGEFAKLFEIIIQLGAILAVVVVYWDKLYTSVINVFNINKKGLRFWINIIVAAIPGVILGFLFHNIIKSKLFNSITVSSALIVGGILMIIIEKRHRGKNRTRSIDKITIRQAFVVGIFQCLALWPGMSRSASTIMGGWIAGLSSVVAAEFSFFLAIPMMIGASTLEIIKTGLIMTNIQFIALVIGFVVAFVVSLLVIEGFIKFLQKRSMRVFCIYRIFIGIIFIVIVFLK